MGVNMDRRALPPEFLELQADIAEARERYIELRTRYRKEIRRLYREDRVFLTAIAEDSPFVYATVRQWAQEDNPDIDDAISEE